MDNVGISGGGSDHGDNFVIQINPIQVEKALGLGGRGLTDVAPPSPSLLLTRLLLWLLLSSWPPRLLLPSPFPALHIYFSKWWQTFRLPSVVHAERERERGSPSLSRRRSSLSCCPFCGRRENRIHKEEPFHKIGPPE